MANENQPVEKLKKAYRILNVPEMASALAIKSSYRKLIKRWHPDKPATNAATHDESVTMTKLINEAYSLIENAPLRYYVTDQVAVHPGVNKYPRAREKREPSSLTDAEIALIEKRTEYAIRIVCGALSGALLGVLVMDLMKAEGELFAATVLCAVAFAAAAVKLGDKVWREIFGIWWKWR